MRVLLDECLPWALRHVRTLAATDWLRASLTTFAESVASLLPGTFEAYARLYHPWQSNDGTSVPPPTWREIAAAAGADMNDPIACASLIWSARDRACIDVGSLPRVVIGPLGEYLRSATTTPERCFFAVWEGFGGSAVPEGLDPKLELPHRRYHVSRDRWKAPGRAMRRCTSIISPRTCGGPPTTRGVSPPRWIMAGRTLGHRGRAFVRYSPTHGSKLWRPRPRHRGEASWQFEGGAARSVGTVPRGPFRSVMSALDCHKHRVGEERLSTQAVMHLAVEIEREADGRWIAEVQVWLASWCMASRAIRPSLGLRRSPFACLPTVSNTTRLAQGAPGKFPG